jgi:hypothetical protein
LPRRGKSGLSHATIQAQWDEGWQKWEKSVTSEQCDEHQRNPRRVAETDRRRKKAALEVLDHELTPEDDEESPEVLAAIDEGIRSLESGERTYTVEEVREHIAQALEKARAGFLEVDVLGSSFPKGPTKTSLALLST